MKPWMSSSLDKLANPYAIQIQVTLKSLTLSLSLSCSAYA